MLYDLCFLADEEKTRTHLRRTDRQLFPQKQSIFKIHRPAQSIYKGSIVSNRDYQNTFVFLIISRKPEYFEKSFQINALAKLEKKSRKSWVKRKMRFLTVTL
jgi:hypothetical protein